jgi:hypothetical protein
MQRLCRSHVENLKQEVPEDYTLPMELLPIFVILCVFFAEVGIELLENENYK